ncbi:MAG: hypothetical protein IJM56_02145 [Clostridia bacterium]|nr:hypothetical protein [Clostridia bacterium]MBQ9408931.1 hypothetical protein [Clostridia bacterium]
MMSVLGLPLKTALDLLSSEGAGNLLITRYDAPRAKDPRGTLRVVKENEDRTHLTVCAFQDAPGEKQ